MRKKVNGMSKKSMKIHHGGGAGKSPAGISIILIICLALLWLVNPVSAGVTTSGDVGPDVIPPNPPNPAWSGTVTTAYVGETTEGSMTLAAPGAYIKVRNMNVGYGVNAEGELTITGRDVSGPSAYLEMNKNDSTGADGNLYVGRSGTGIMHVLDDAWVATDNTSYIGYSAGSTGTVNVVGDGTNDPNKSVWWTGDLNVGKSGEGTLNISNGGKVSNHVDQPDDSWVARGAGTGLVTVDGRYSEWVATGNLYVGDYGEGTVVVTDRGQVTAGSIDTHCYIGYTDYSGAMGGVTVNGIGSTWINNGDLYVGYEAAGTTEPDVEGGTLTVTAGGQISNTHGSIGHGANSTGLVTVDGTDSKWTNSRNLIVGDDGVGTLTITDNGLVKVGSSTPGWGGVLTIDDDDDADSFINIGSGGKLSLHSTSSVTTLSGFFDLISGTDAIRYWDGDSWEILTTGATDYYTVSYDGGTEYATLAATNKLLGDANGDGVVSAGDYASVQANYGNTGDPGIPGDANWDGVVSAGDYASIQANFGHTLP